MTFPEHQIYIRSNGRVQFFTFTPLTQAIFTGISLLFLGWVAFTSVNVIFKDRIIAAKERYFEQMQASYEGRIADLQLSYDELNGALITAEDRFKATADAFEAKQRVLTSLIERKENLRASLGLGATDPARNTKTAGLSPSLREGIGMGGSLDVITTGMAASLARPFAAGNSAIIKPIEGMPTTGNETSILSRRLAAVPEVLSGIAHPERAPFLRDAVQRLGSLFGRKVSSSNLDSPAFHEMEEQQTRIASLGEAQPALLGDAKKQVDLETARLKRALQSTGINPKSIQTRVSRDQASEGGPLLLLGPTQIATQDQAFNVGVIDTMTSLNELANVVTALNAVPLIEPFAGEISSGFGARNDPFTEELALHSGVDLRGEKGSDVHATAPGIVVFAGPRGAYGNTVEVDHGYGIRTRYAHLSKIVVAAGAKLDKGSVLGKLGSTGRSTGPHVHYEVWYDDAVRDPEKFIKAGRNVRKE